MVAVIVPTVWKSFPFFTHHAARRAAVDPGVAVRSRARRRRVGVAAVRPRHVAGHPRPALLAVLLNALWTFREFDIIYAATRGGPAGATETLGILVYARRSRASASALRRRSAC